MWPPGSPMGSLGGDDLRSVVGLLILRQLYDGDVIDWPIPPDHPDKFVFDWLEEQGFVARWDRIWPLRDRYRLTPAGTGEIERWYDPASAESMIAELKAVPPKKRASWLASKGKDPLRWPALHDPYTHWETWRSDPGSAWLMVHEAAAVGGVVHHEVHELHAEPKPIIDDLDQQAGHAHHHPVGGTPAIDVS
jgi:hypothetical protein